MEVQSSLLGYQGHILTFTPKTFLYRPPRSYLDYLEDNCFYDIRPNAYYVSLFIQGAGAVN